MKKIIKTIAITGILFFSCSSINAQFLTPQLVDSTELDETKGAIDTPEIQDVKPPKITKPNPGDSAVAATENNLKLLELEAQRIKIEQELEVLKRKNNLSPEEKKLIKAKNENLLLIAAKERYLLEKELKILKRDTSANKQETGRIYGQDFFRNKDFKQFQKTDEIVATEGYVIGSGDMLHLEVWGSRYWSKDYPVGESGAIDIVGYQKIYIKGLTLKQARSLIGDRLGIGGGDNSYSVTVTRPRLVTVTVLGEVYKPGTYTLPASNSAFNVLVSMGGPNNLGSVRNIYIKRDGRIQDSFDVYEHFNNISHPREVYLQNNDYIIVTAARRIVEITGAVIRPGTYELKESDKLSDVLQFVGGTQVNAYMQDVVLGRFTNSSYESISVNADSIFKKGKDLSLTGVESISIKSISKDVSFIAKIEGAISVSGSYKIKDGMRLSGLIKTANGLTREAYLEKAYLIRNTINNKREYLEFSPEKVLKSPLSAADLLIQNGDEIYIFSNQEINKQFPIQITGAVYKPISKIAPVKGLKLGELLFMAGGLAIDASDSIGYIIRGTSTFESELIYFIPKEVNSNPEFYNIEIMGGDVVKIHFKYESGISYRLKCRGPVKMPYDGNFIENTRITDLVNMCGGIEPSANSTRALIFRENLKTGQRSTLTVNISDLMKNPANPANILLKRNDELVILKYSNSTNDFEISLYGAVRNPGSLSYSAGLTLQNAIDLMDGFQFFAAGSTIEIIRNFNRTGESNKFFKPTLITAKVYPDLKIDSTFSNFNLEPFDKIFVRTNPYYVPLKTIELKGSLFYPGTYALQLNNERVSSIIKRGGGLRPEASINGATLRRVRGPGDTLSIVLNLQKALNHKNSPYNYYLQEGDIITVPTAENVVLITGDVNKYTTGDVGTYFKPGKRAKFYIKNFGGGFTKTSDRKHVVVLHQNGARKGTKNLILFKIYPKIKSGDKIIVGSKAGAGPTGPKVNVDTLINKTLARATALFSLFALYKLAVAK